MNKGFSLLEMVVVLSVFALLAVISSQALILTLQGAKKSNELATVRENVDYAVQIMERQLHNATEVKPCPNPDSQMISFTDQEGDSSTFSCMGISAGPGGENEKGYIASSSARLTSDEVAVTSCTISCTEESSGLPPYVEINISARNVNPGTGPASSVTTSTRVFLRNY